MTFTWNRPRWLRALAYRVPFSRFARLASWLLWGEEVIEWRGVKIGVNPGELHGYYTYFFGDYETAELDKLEEVCRDASVFVDVGANYGLFSLAVARACPRIWVFAFEPDRDIALSFRANIARNDSLAGQIQLVESAVGEADGVGAFAPSGRAENPGLGRLVTDSRGGAREKVPVVRLDSFFRERPRPDVVKIDVEGAELQVLRGMGGLFGVGCPRAIMMETDGLYFGGGADEFNSQVVRELEREGFDVCRLRFRSWVPLDNPSELGSRSHLLALRRCPPQTVLRPEL